MDGWKPPWLVPMPVITNCEKKTETIRARMTASNTTHKHGCRGWKRKLHKFIRPNKRTKSTNYYFTEWDRKLLAAAQPTAVPSKWHKTTPTPPKECKTTASIRKMANMKATTLSSSGSQIIINYSPPG